MLTDRGRNTRKQDYREDNREENSRQCDQREDRMATIGGRGPQPEPPYERRNCRKRQWRRFRKVETFAKWGISCLVLHTPPPHTEIRTQNHNKQMDVHFEDFRANQHTVEVGEDDTVEGLRRKVASAMGLPEDSFCMSFGDEAMGEGADMTQLSAGDTIILTKTKTQKYEAIAELHALGETDLTPERLEEVEDPEVVCLLLQAEVATVIPDAFLREASLTHLDLSAVSFVTQIGDDFLEFCTSLTSVDLSGLSNVTVIGSYFLSGCYSLTSLDLTSLSKVEYVGSGFAIFCTALTSIYLSGCSSEVSNEVRTSDHLRHLVVEAPPTRSTDESPEQAHKRQRHAQ